MTKKINLKLKKLIEENGITQKELAERAGVRENTISDLMKGDKKGIHFETLEKIATALNVNQIDEIIDFVEGDNEF